MKGNLLGLIWLIVILGLVIVIGSHPALGLAGLGVVLIGTALGVELASGQIWKTYVAGYKRGGRKGAAPRPIYRWINVYLLWPLIFILGVLSLYAAWRWPN